MSFFRQIYQILGVFAGPSPATGAHFSSGLYSGVSLINQLNRIQSANDSFTQSRVDVNQFGQLGALDRIIVEAPMADIEFSWHSADFSNERFLGFDVSGINSCVVNLLNKSQDERNYFIAAAPEGVDLNSYTGQTQVKQITNACISSYRAEGAVGRLPTVTCKAEGLNWAASTGSILQLLKAVDRNSGTIVQNGMLYSLPVGTTGLSDQVVALRPGDITVNINNAAIGFSVPDLKIQSYNINMPLNRENLMKLGTFFAYSKEIRWPVNVTCSITALAGDINTGDLSLMYCNDSPYELIIQLHSPSCSGYGPIAMQYDLKSFKIDGEQNPNAVGSNSMVTINYTAQLTGPSDFTHGVFFSGNSW